VQGKSKEGEKRHGGSMRDCPGRRKGVEKIKTPGLRINAGIRQEDFPE